MEIQKIAKSVSIAIDEALKELDTTIDKIEFEVLQEPSSGFLGLGRRPAKVLIKLVELDNYQEIKREEAKQELKREEAKQELKREEARQELKREEARQELKREEAKQELKREEAKQELKREEARQELKREEARQELKREEARQELKREEAKQELKREEAKQELKVEESKQELKVEEAKQEVNVEEENSVLITKVEKKPTNPNAIQEATDFLTQVLNKMDIDVKIDANINNKNDLFIELKGENVGVAIGKRGQTLDSLQYLVNLVINKGDYAYTSVTIDTQQYRERRKKTLEKLALSLGEKTKKLGKSFNLEPMNPFERQIIHSTLQSDRLIKTYSIGEEPHRYVVIAPKNKNNKNNKNKNI